ncbi:MAG: assimilatory sulfite reductase (NADPH) hemoprotein subunit [Pontiellaceae bacterium]|nr:assimilatory sulfite reductase (NADPH) hemoprotein subunit [Pontiellaceae bacterium]MBN2784061.1 assimilatory sulfite reductase (NADPH) hemoprotein subunit [Pontiellaceae bacterium]
MSEEKQLTEVEHIKARSRHLRGTIEEGLRDQTTGALPADDTQLTKFHGFYQQDERDLREERRHQKLEPLYSFMLRARVPGGVITAQQWKAIDAIARELTGGGLRLTTRQTFQYHGILKRNIKPLIQGINQAMIDSIAACGDVNRNVLCNTNPVESALHKRIYEDAVALSKHLLPKTRAYHEIWLDEERIANHEEEQEPIYGDTYLPRKFKIAVAVPPHNDVDVNGNDLSFVAIIENGELKGYDVLAGGGMGNTHGDTRTYPQIAKNFGFIKPGDVLKVAEAVVTTQRDFGDRTDRKQARLKYTIDRLGTDVFKQHVEERSGVLFADAAPYEFTMHSDRYGWTENSDGTWNLTLFIEHGRIKDYEDGPQMLQGLLKMADLHGGDFRMTATQNLIVAQVEKSKKEAIEKLAREHGLLRTVSRLRENSMACVALPTCTLAMAEAERYLPDLITKLEDIVSRHGLADQPIVVRMTGCPNGCARPFLAEIAFVGKAPGKYNLYLGGDGKGTRLVKLYRENIGEEEILETLEPLIERYSKERQEGEGFGDFVVRAGIVPAVYDGRDFHQIHE